MLNHGALERSAFLVARLANNPGKAGLAILKLTFTLESLVGLTGELEGFDPSMIL